MAQAEAEGFKTSSFSVRNPVIRFCVGVKQTDDGVLVRSTKDPQKKTLSFTKDEWEAFVAGVKNGEFD